MALKKKLEEAPKKKRSGTEQKRRQKVRAAEAAAVAEAEKLREAKEAAAADVEKLGKDGFRGFVAYRMVLFLGLSGELWVCRGPRFLRGASQ